MSARGARCAFPLFLLVAATLIACAHDDALAPEAGAPQDVAGADIAAQEEASASGATASDDAAPPDPLDEALRPPPRDDAGTDEEPDQGIQAMHPGKLERIERRRRQSRYEAATGTGSKEDGEPETDKSEGLIHIESESYGTPGLVLIRAMEGAQTLGYTVLTIDERDLYFIAIKKASFFQTFMGTQRGACKIAVGTRKSADDRFTRVTLKARAQVAGAEKQCEKDLKKIRLYARGEVSDKHKRKRRRVRPAWQQNNED
jgi:hypothetical protein